MVVHQLERRKVSHFTSEPVLSMGWSGRQSATVLVTSCAPTRFMKFLAHVTGTGAWAREVFGPVPLPADAGALQAASSVPLAVPRPEPAPARDYAWCGATRINVPHLLGGAEVDVMLQVRTTSRRAMRPA